ncbi:MAG: ribosome-associated translation inhibitor RaiA [Clostridia bacterium]|jgi:putative sigma-54 modulation protein|nr:sigma 54 modulation protein/ribosomal protein S30EA [Clostridium sp. CAG:571]HJJ06420.1 ribosome-associated translation inhibitor RaiA [Clostridiaceae bacterium]HJJ14071.1 ribosome-associated translation inhibitor RaiA [Clostridiaceae bacterium]
MNIKITGKELKATDSIKNYIEKKCERLVKYFGEDFDVQATIKTEGKDQVAEMHVNTTNGVFRAVTGSKDLYASIDKNIDIVEGQIRKMKTKKDKQNMTESIRLKETNMSFEKEEEIENEIVKTLFYDVKPVSPEDAKLILQEEPQNKFLAFVNVETGKVNVMYKLKDGKNFGLVEPEA